jgi:hypothetical protein
MWWGSIFGRRTRRWQERRDDTKAECFALYSTDIVPPKQQDTHLKALVCGLSLWRGEI